MIILIKFKIIIRNSFAIFENDFQQELFFNFKEEKSFLVKFSILFSKIANIFQ